MAFSSVKKVQGSKVQRSRYRRLFKVQKFNVQGRKDCSRFKSSTFKGEKIVQGSKVQRSRAKRLFKVQKFNVQGRKDCSRFKNSTFKV
jgi:hypothetical protein